MRHDALVGLLSEIVGSRIKVAGFPDSVLMTIHDPKTWQAVRCLSVPAHRLIDFVGDPPREPREIEEAMLDSVSSNSITVSLIREQSEFPALQEATCYKFRLAQIISLELLPVIGSVQL